MKKARRMTNRIFSLFLAFVMLCTISDVTAFAQTADTTAPHAQERRSLNPVHHCSDNGDEDTTDWNYIYFGSYPQSKVEDPEISQKIKKKEGDSKEGELDGERYRKGVWEFDFSWYKYEPVKWKILQEEEDAYFVLADRAVYWELSVESIKYLEETFMEMAFSQEEQEDIIEKEKGKVYLLTVEEAANEKYGFCQDKDKASASRRVNQTDYCVSSLSKWKNDSAVELFDGWWLDGRNMGVVTGLFSNQDSNGSIKNISKPSGNKVTTGAYVVPALRVSKSGSSWFFDPDSSSSIDPEVTQAAADAINELESGYSQEDYSEENWAKVQEIIDAAKEELGGVDNLEDVESVLNKAKEKIEEIPTEGGETPEPKPDLDSLLPEDVRKKLLGRKFDTIDGGKQAMYSADHELTIEVFTSTTCPYSGAALNYLQEMNLPKDKVDIFSMEVYTPDAEKIRSWAKTYELDTQKITFCYSTKAELISENPLKIQPYAQYDLQKYSYYYFGTNNLATPTYVFRDKDGKILAVTHSWKNTAQLVEILTSIGYGDLIPEGKKPMEAEFEVTYGQTEARQMFSRINEFRTGDGAWEWNETDTEKITHTDLDELTYDYELEKVAMQRAADLAALYSHTRPDGTTCFTAYPSAFDSMTRGENIAMGYATEEAVFTAWKEENDPYSGQGHRRNMLSEKFQAVGIGHAVYNGRHYWVQEFSSGVVSDRETAANDSKTPVKVKITKDIIKSQKLKSDADEIQLKAGTNQKLPQVNLAVTTNLMNQLLEFPVTAEWSVSSGEDVVRISESTLYALKEGNATVTASYNGETTAVRIVVAPGITAEDVQETLQDYESKFEDYGETEKAELEALLETIKGEIEAAQAEGDLEAVEAALAKMEAALEEKAAGKKEEAQQELDGLKDSITADEKLDDEQRAEIEDVLREAEAAVENAKDATAVKDALADAQQKIEEIKTMSPELRQEKTKAQQQISAWNEADFLAKYGETEQAKIKEIADKLAADMKGKTEPSEIQALLNQAKAEVEAIKTEEQKESEQAALNTARNNALNDLDLLESKLNDYRAAEQEKIKKAIAEAKAKIDAAEDEDAVKKALEAARQVFDEQPTDAELKKQEEEKKPSKSLSLNITNVTIYTGKASNSITVNPTVTGASRIVTWKTDNPKVATVQNGRITAVGKGTATITATANGISKTVRVTVKDPTLMIKKGSKKFTKSKLTVKKKKKEVLTVTVSPKNSGISIGKLTAKQKKIASVTLKKGKITIKGKKKGTFNLQIKSGKTTKKIKITVK